MRHESILDEWLNGLLKDVAERIQLTAIAYEKAVDRYNRIAEYLSDAASGITGLAPVIYPQGSFRTQTTISAREDDEDYDIDLILELSISRWSDPDDVLNTVAKAMERAQGRLQFQGIEVKKRCVTIEYSDMHLDITPAVLLDADNPRVIGIFDRHPDRPDHPVANPEGFAQWLDGKVLPEDYLRNRALKASTHPVPDQKPLEAKPNRLLSIQLLKRFRDLSCDRGKYSRCPSVLLARLVADAPTSDGLFNDLRLATQQLAKSVLMIPPPVLNPRCGQDCLSDRWPAASGDEHKFARDLRFLDAKLVELLETGTQANKQRILEELFGERPARRAFEAAAKRLGAASANGAMTVGSGRGALGSSSASSILVPKHRFYGQEK